MIFANIDSNYFLNVFIFWISFWAVKMFSSTFMESVNCTCTFWKLISQQNLHCYRIFFSLRYLETIPFLWNNHEWVVRLNDNLVMLHSCPIRIMNKVILRIEISLSDLIMTWSDLSCLEFDSVISYGRRTRLNGMRNSDYFSCSFSPNLIEWEKAAYTPMIFEK